MMKVVIQRVSSASVTVGDEVVSKIGRGLCCLVGISRYDTDDDSDYMARKLLNLRIFEGDQRRWDQSVKDKGLELLCVSQFTLHSHLKGNKLDFHNAMEASRSQEFYNGFLDKLRQQYHPDMIKDGRFGAMMKVNIENDGPVTIILESPNEVKRNKGGDSQNCET